METKIKTAEQAAVDYNSAEKILLKNYDNCIKALEVRYSKIRRGEGPGRGRAREWAKFVELDYGSLNDFFRKRKLLSVKKLATALINSKKFH